MNLLKTGCGLVCLQVYRLISSKNNHQNADKVPPRMSFLHLYTILYVLNISPVRRDREMYKQNRRQEKKIFNFYSKSQKIAQCVKSAVDIPEIYFNITTDLINSMDSNDCIKTFTSSKHLTRTKSVIAQDDNDLRNE